MNSVKELREIGIRNLIRTLEDSIPEAKRMETRGLDGCITGGSYDGIYGHLLATIKIAIIHLKTIQIDSQE